MLSVSLFPGSRICYHFSMTPSPPASTISDAGFDLFRHRSSTEEENEGIYARSSLSKYTEE